MLDLPGWNSGKSSGLEIYVYIYIYILFEAMRYDEIFQRVGIDIGEGQGQSPQILLEFRQKKESQQKRLKSTTDP